MPHEPRKSDIACPECGSPMLAPYLPDDHAGWDCSRCAFSTPAWVDGVNGGELIARAISPMGEPAAEAPHDTPTEAEAHGND